MRNQEAKLSRMQESSMTWKEETAVPMGSKATGLLDLDTTTEIEVGATVEMIAVVAKVWC